MKSKKDRTIVTAFLNVVTAKNRRTQILQVAMDNSEPRRCIIHTVYYIYIPVTARRAPNDRTKIRTKLIPRYPVREKIAAMMYI